MSSAQELLIIIIKITLLNMNLQGSVLLTSCLDILLCCRLIFKLIVMIRHFAIERNDADIEEHFKDQEKILDTAKTNILAAQKRQKERHDCKHSNPDVFKNGVLVLKKDMKRKNVLVEKWI